MTKQKILRTSMRSCYSKSDSCFWSSKLYLEITELKRERKSQVKSTSKALFVESQIVKIGVISTNHARAFMSAAFTPINPDVSKYIISDIAVCERGWEAARAPAPFRPDG